MKSLYVHANWDDQAKVWVASSDDVPGLATEAESYDQLMAKLKIMIPELMALNGEFEDGITAAVPFELLARRFETATRVH